MPNLLTRAALGAVLLLGVIAAAAIALSTSGSDRSGVHGGTTAGAPPPPASSRPSDPRQLSVAVDHAQAVIDDPASTGQELASAALLQQLVVRMLADETRAGRRATLALLTPRARSSMSADLAASAALESIATRPRNLPSWRIADPPPPGTQQRYFEQAQAQSGIPWQYLAAIEFIETRFGRIHGVSTAGAQGPMQFLPATWARYGRGSITDPRQAILGAARYLVANGAPRHMPEALYAYNHSTGYVRAVEDYAAWMRTDPRAYDGYYGWQVIYNRASGPVILPVGYPRKRPISLRQAMRAAHLLP